MYFLLASVKYEGVIVQISDDLKALETHMDNLKADPYDELIQMDIIEGEVIGTWKKSGLN